MLLSSWGAGSVPPQPLSHNTDNHQLACTVLGEARRWGNEHRPGLPAPEPTMAPRHPGRVLSCPVLSGWATPRCPRPSGLTRPCSQTPVPGQILGPLRPPSQTPKSLLRWGQGPFTAWAPGAKGRARASPFPTGSISSKQALSPGAQWSPKQESQDLPRPHALPSSHSTDTDSGHRPAVQWGWGEVGSAEATPGSWEDGCKASKNTQHSTHGLWRLGGAD